MEQIFSSEAAKVLGIGVSSLRSYAVELESKGYGFERGSNNGRIFRQEDISLLKKMMEKISAEGLTIGQAAEIALAEADEKSMGLQPPPAGIRIEVLCEQIKHLEEQQAEFANINMELAKQVERLNEKLEERERDQALFERVYKNREKQKRKSFFMFRPFSMLAGKKSAT
ncbi:MAG TPA: MerR family transcriptional regulator [Bacillaceae bacterium]